VLLLLRTHTVLLLHRLSFLCALFLCVKPRAQAYERFVCFSVSRAKEVAGVAVERRRRIRVIEENKDGECSCVQCPRWGPPCVQ
jgi:hypothetical protein